MMHSLFQSSLKLRVVHQSGTNGCNFKGRLELRQNIVRIFPCHEVLLCFGSISAGLKCLGVILISICKAQGFLRAPVSSEI